MNVTTYYRVACFYVSNTEAKALSSGEKSKSRLTTRKHSTPDSGSIGNIDEGRLSNWYIYLEPRLHRKLSCSMQRVAISRRQSILKGQHSCLALLSLNNFLVLAVKNSRLFREPQTIFCVYQNVLSVQQIFRWSAALRYLSSGHSCRLVLLEQCTNLSDSLQTLSSKTDSTNFSSLAWMVP